MNSAQKGFIMKTTIITLISAAILPLFAAENIPFIWQALNTDGKNSKGKTVITENNKVKLKYKSPQYGIHIQITIPEVKDGAYYRLVLCMKTETPVTFIERTMQKGKKDWDSRILNDGALKVFYLIGNKAKQCNGWMFYLAKKCNVELTQLSVEVLSENEVKNNIVYQVGLVPGLWRGLWGKKPMEFPMPVVKKETASPNGEYLHFEAPKAAGFPTLLPFPFIPDKDFECSVWLRSNEKGQFRMQILNSTGSLSFGFKKEWTEYKLKGKTLSQPSLNAPCFMIVSANSDSELPAFDFGGISFRYVNQ